MRARLLVDLWRAPWRRKAGVLSEFVFGYGRK